VRLASTREAERTVGETFTTEVGDVRRMPKKITNTVEKLREAKATTLKRERLARSCAIGGKDVVGEVKGVDSRAGGVGGRTIATICSQFHKLR